MFSFAHESERSVMTLCVVRLNRVLASPSSSVNVLGTSLERTAGTNDHVLSAPAPDGVVARSTLERR